MCKLLTIGLSVEKRDIYALSIIRDDIRGTVIVEAGMHGNEWITTEFVTFLAQNLIDLKNTSDDRLITVANNYQWLLIPIANPDGYKYSHTGVSKGFKVP